MGCPVRPWAGCATAIAPALRRCYARGMPEGISYTEFLRQKAKGEESGDIAPDLSQLDDMSHGELVSLCRRICAARWGEVALMSVEERFEAAKLKLWHGGLTEKEIMKALPALREVMDREKGKPAQSIAMTVEDKGIGKLSDERLLRLERELARMTGEDALVLPAMPGKLGDG